MMKKFFLPIGISVLIACAPSTVSQPTTWISSVFYGIGDVLRSACDQGFAAGRSATPNLGKIFINTPRGVVEFHSSLSWVYAYCAYSQGINPNKPEIGFTGANLYVRDLSLKASEIKPSVVFTTKEGKDLVTVSPSSSNTSREYHVFGLAKNPGLTLDELRSVDSFTIIIERNGATERYKFTSAEFSPLGQPLQR
jgi:hypothetical protein